MLSSRVPVSAGARTAGTHMAAEPKKPETSRPLPTHFGLLVLAALAFAAGATWLFWARDGALSLLGGAVLAAGGAACVLWSRARAAVPAGMQTPAATLVSRTEVIIAGDRLLARTRSRHQPLTVAVVELADVADVEQLFGRAVAESIMGRLAAKLRALVTSRGLAARTGQTQFSLLLPGFAADEALQALHTAFGEAGWLEHEGRDELVLLPDLQVDAVGPELSSVEDLYVSLCAAIALVRRPAAAGPAAPDAAERDRAALVQAQERRASLYAPTLPMTP
jgi:GGDEF domain-containing protein